VLQLLLKAASRSGLSRLFALTPVRSVLKALHTHQSLSFLEAAHILLLLQPALEAAARSAL
jgi:hypothetical protein